MIEPDRRLRAELKRRCKEAAGFDFADVRWDREEEALCIFQWDRTRKHETRRGLPLLDELDQPRQINQADVDDVVNNIYGHRERVDKWKERWDERQAELKAKRLADREALSGETAREIIRIARHGITPRFFFGKAHEDKKTKKNKNLVVNDRRRVK